MVVAQKDVCTSIPDKVNQNPQSLTLSEKHYGVVKTPLEWSDVNCAAVDCSVPTSLPPSAVHPDESVVEMQSRSHGPIPT